MLDDGVYDVIVVDAEAVENEADTVSLDLTILGGEMKGEVVSVRARGQGDPVDLLGLPGTLTVADGRPDVSLES